MPKENSVAFVATDLLQYYDKLFAHSHASFEAVHMALEDQRGFRDTHLVENIMVAWMVHKALRALWETHATQMTKHVWRIERHSRNQVHESFTLIEKMLRQHIMLTETRLHTCLHCSSGAVVVDGVRGLAPRSCAFPDCVAEEYPETDTNLCFPCGNMPHGPYNYCLEHLAKAGPNAITCPGARGRGALHQLLI